MNNNTSLHDNTPVNILIVDDEPKNLTVLETLLDDPGYRLVKAASADEALLALVTQEFALLILDIRMPEMTGIELAQMIKERKKTARVPIIFLTAYYNDDAHVLEGYGSGAVDYLQKPVNAAILRSKVAVFAELHRKNRELATVNLALLDEVKQRRNAEEQLRELNDSLEQRVAERTQALRESEHFLLEAKVAAEAANEAKSRFLANMSHELRTPMNAILGMIDVALPQARDPMICDCLQTAQESATLLLTLLNDLLDSAKIDSGKLELESAPFSLRRMLDQITRVLSARANEKGLCLYCRMADDIPDRLQGDSVRLQQILLNLAGNAIKFTERGVVEVKLHALSRDNETCLTFAIRDTGIGIAPTELDHLFQPFAQADASTARKFGGTGLGLAISKNLIEMMGGRLWVESKSGEGSTFYFTIVLPLAIERSLDNTDLQPVPALLPVIKHLRILLAEDNPANQKVATYILHNRGHLVETAENGREAIVLAAQNRYDIILMDVQMPIMDGFEATAAIRKQEGGDRFVPIVAMTALAMSGDRERCLAAGMNGYLSKPINAAEMITTIESLAGRPEFVAPSDIAASHPEEITIPATPAILEPEKSPSNSTEGMDVFQEMTQYFFEEVEVIFPLLRAALADGDPAEIGRLGHRMKGTLLYLDAQSATEAAFRVEQFGLRSTDLSEATNDINMLEQECFNLKTELTEQLRSVESKRCDSPKLSEQVLTSTPPTRLLE